MNEYFIRNVEVLESKIGEEVVMLDVNSGFYFGLNEVGSVIWGFLEHKKSFDELIEMLMAKYDVDREVCVAETQELLQHLIEKKLIHRI
jgi:hypothetical protein